MVLAYFMKRTSISGVLAWLKRKSDTLRSTPSISENPNYRITVPSRSRKRVVIIFNLKKSNLWTEAEVLGLIKRR
jgi:hypothetical protein